MSSDVVRPSALVVDWGGVLTNDLFSVTESWTSQEDFDPQHFADVLGEWFGDEARVNPVHALERGELEVPDFEREIAAELTRQTGREIASEGLLTRLFNHFEHAHDMTALVRRARQHGITSWGEFYPDHIFDGMFDVVVISGRVGMRKPESDIFWYTCRELAVPPTSCVFVDDLAHNVRAAALLGFTAVQHISYDQTAEELSALFGLDLRD